MLQDYPGTYRPMLFVFRAMCPENVEPVFAEVREVLLQYKVHVVRACGDSSLRIRPNSPAWRNFTIFGLQHLKMEAPLATLRPRNAEALTNAKPQLCAA